MKICYSATLNLGSIIFSINKSKIGARSGKSNKSDKHKNLSKPMKSVSTENQSNNPESGLHKRSHGPYQKCTSKLISQQ